MRTIPRIHLLIGLFSLAQPAFADPPIATYIFPPGGRRGTALAVRVGGLNLNSKASFEMLGRGIDPPEIRRIETIWFEGPRLPLPESQQAEDYPKDYSARLNISADAPPGPRAWRIWTSQGASGSLPFVVGDLPEVVERETDGEPEPVPVDLPVTINGRIFPREDIDLWSFRLKAGQSATAEVNAGRLGSPLEPWLEILDSDGRRVAEGRASPRCDVRTVELLAPIDQTYTVKLHDINAKGGQNYVYRLTLTTEPNVERVFPLGGQRGTVVPFTMRGTGVVTRTARVTLPETGKSRGPETTTVRFPSGGTAIVELDDLAETTETEPNADASQASRMKAPGVANGQIGRPGDVDVWCVTLAKSSRYQVELRAASLGSDLDGLLSVSDAGVKVLAQAEGVTPGSDASLTFEPPADGRFLIHVKDRFRSRGGPTWSYRLRVAEIPAADFRLSFAGDTLTVPRGGETKLKIEAERIGGFSGPINLEVQGLPSGVSAAKSVIAATANSTEITLKSEAGSAIQSSRLTIQGTGEVGGKRLLRVAARAASASLPEIDSVRLAVSLPTPFSITGPLDFGWAPRGSVRHRKYRIDRKGFKGPIDVQLADRQARHLQGVTGPVLRIPPGVEEFDYAVTLPPSMEIGRTSRCVVMAAGVVSDRDGTLHEVSYSSPGAEVQMVAVIGPGQLGLEPLRTSLSLTPGKTVELPFKLARGEHAGGPVQVRLIAPAAVLGLSAEPLALKSGQDQGVLRIECKPGTSSPRSAEIILRAEAGSPSEPLCAEARVAVVSAASLED